ncbi:hypothetical protein EVAR_85081_1 [Eumeta japonica]|uniref:V-type proton ATPase subunit a n=1 Tax=Eumeta variegata TaxID=151549 RepID=A0A4C1XCK2_EUMVA|nr:hypothetical protein EVAR_85081_1 [Eumeta japonica]
MDLMAYTMYTVQTIPKSPDKAGLERAGQLALNPQVNDFQRRYVSEVRRCSEMERKLRWVAAELPVPAAPPARPPPRNLSAREVNILEERIDYIESEIQEMTRNARNLKADYLSLNELKILIEKMQTLFEDHDAHRKISASIHVKQANDADGDIGHLGFIAGVVATARVPAFEKMLWRISHGNIFFKQTRIEKPLLDPFSGHQLLKSVFVVFFHGEQIKMRVKKVCHGFQATLYPCPATTKEQHEMLAGVSSRINDLEVVLKQTEEHRRLVLAGIAHDISTWIVIVRKEKAIYHTLNMFSMDIVKKCLIGECWVPKQDVYIVQKALENGVKQSGSPIPSILHHVPTNEIPPTFNRTNKVTKGFQNLIDSYGIASYREVNPALYTIITFPFLFAVMFGDVGHGIIMTIFAAVLVVFEDRFMKKKSDNEVWNIFFGGRYIILLMGIFSVYTGTIYNDFFSKSINAFGSSWFNPYDNLTLIEKTMSLAPEDAYRDYPYPYGMDPVWQITLLLSVLIELTDDGFNFLSFCHSHFRKPEAIFLQYMPQIVFLLLLFWYLCILMFVKWIIYSAANSDPAYTSLCAPSVLILFINMMLLKPTEAVEPCKPYMYTGQEALQNAFLYIALLCVPVMLFGKPIHKMMVGRKRTAYQNGVEGGDQQEDEADSEKINWGELLITQAIHTIEYVLGAVSHTASYLRLWALSLAHAQLSAVLWKQVLKIGLRGRSYYNAITLYVVFAIWAFFTVAILVVMEGLSAFLHTLRLHWVEFMSKFYDGQGYAFAPFSFAAILEEEEEEPLTVESKDANNSPPDRY